MSSPKNHRDNISSLDSIHQFSRTQDIPYTSLNIIYSFKPSKDSAIIDIVGGQSTRVDFLFNEWSASLLIPHISKEAILNSLKRPRDKNRKENRIFTEDAELNGEKSFDVRSDRTAWNCPVLREQIEQNRHTASRSARSGGFMILGTFSDRGPGKFSGLDLKRFSETEPEQSLTTRFRKIQCITVDHFTPFQIT